MMRETLPHFFAGRPDLLAYVERHAVMRETLPGLVRAFNSRQKFALAD